MDFAEGDAFCKEGGWLMDQQVELCRIILDLELLGDDYFAGFQLESGSLR